ncbi:unnamed protein product [Adineta ricciae]|uniref:ubiquitinyl hydrolase 1 n=1 Tax=Adineta ricciae TaxID=249248 RepID=A0A815IYV7_ADIRI|nr:unnamed protein product [Adineta ricciae]
MLTKGIQVNVLTLKGTALYHSIKLRDFSISKLLIENGADCNLVQLDFDHNNEHPNDGLQHLCFISTPIDFLCVENNPVNNEILKYLLEHRSAITKGMINQRIRYCVQLFHDGNQETLFDYAASYFLRKNMYDHLWVVGEDPSLTMITGILNINEPSVDGGTHQAFFTLIIRSLFEELVRFELNQSSNIQSKHEYEHMLRELRHNLEACNLLVNISCIANEHVELFYSSIIRNIIHQLKNMERNEEYTLPVKWLEHAICLNFIRKSYSIVIRIDNLNYNESTEHQTYGTDEKNCIMIPKIIGEIPLKKLDDNTDYFKSLLMSMKKTLNRSDGIETFYNNRKLKYLDTSRVAQMTYQLEDLCRKLECFRPQAESNCFFKSHESGLAIRSNNYNIFRKIITIMGIYAIKLRGANLLQQRNNLEHALRHHWVKEANIKAVGMFTSFPMDNILRFTAEYTQYNFAELMVGKRGELFAIFYGSNITVGCGLEIPDEKEILSLFLKYVFPKVENAEENDYARRIFSITDEQKNRMKTIVKILEEWFVDLEEVNCIRKSSEQDQNLKNYVTKLQKKIRDLQDICVLPSGLAQVSLSNSNHSDFLMLENKYSGPYFAASIIECDSKEFKSLIQMDTISPYHRSLRELTTDKISLGIEIKRIPNDKFDDNFFLPFVTLKTIRSDTAYKLEHLYEVVIAKLAGEGNLKNEKEFFVDIEEKGYFSLSWTLIKNVFYYLLKKFFNHQEAHSLYMKILCKFHFYLLTNYFHDQNQNNTIIVLSKMLDELTQNYGFNRVIQICQLIENFVFLIVKENRFKNWYSDSKSNLIVVKMLVQIGYLYYNCSAIIFSELYPDENQDIVRNDDKIGPSLRNYKISTELQTISLQSILPQLALPESKWFYLLKNIKEYYELSSVNNEQSTTEKLYLFHWSSLIIREDSDRTNTDVIYILNVLINSLPDIYSSFKETLQDVKVNKLTERWCELLFTDKYIPILLISLREISYLSRLSLYGFSKQTVEKTRYSSYNKSMFNSQNKVFLLRQFTGRYQIQHLKQQTSLTNEYNTIHCDSKYECDRDLNTDLYNKIDSYVDNRKCTDFVLVREQNKYQRLIAFKCSIESESYMDENKMISSQNEKPDNLTRPQYYRLGCIQLYNELRYILLYIGLKNEEINFEIEEHCYLVKQALYKSVSSNLNCILEKDFQNKNFAHVFINIFIKITLDLKEKLTQYKSIGHAIDILLYLYDFCSNSLKTEINNCLKELQNSFSTYISTESASTLKDNQIITSILSCYFILTYKHVTMFDKINVIEILKFRILIDNNFRLNYSVPSSLYIKTMRVLFNLNSKIENIIDKNLDILNISLNHSNELWKKDTKTNSYLNSCYSFIPLKGRILKNGHSLTCLPSRILNNSHYEECFGKENFLVEISERHAFDCRLRCYKAKSNVQINLLANNQIWIENNDETFVSRNYLSKLPKFLIKDCSYYENEKILFYNHWYKNDKIYIKNQNKQIQFEIDLKNKEIYSNIHNMYIIPFIKHKFDQSNILYRTFSQIENDNYILVLKNNLQDDVPKMIYLLRLNLKFKFENNKILSEVFKDYRLSSNQHIDTLNGLSQYLVLETDMEYDNPIKCNQKIIIPYCRIEKEDLFFDNRIKLNLDKLGKPRYFSYEIDENLKWINAETTAGNLYLALLYFKTATLDKDLFLQMNGYEICVEILKTCWQSNPYSDIEFNLILNFFDKRFLNLEEPCSNDINLKEIFEISTCGLTPFHRNTHAILLRLIYLLIDSYQTDFLIKIDNKEKRFYSYFIENGFLNYHLNFYLIFKNRIDKRCRLSLEEEKKLLLFCVKNYPNSRIFDYFQFINHFKTLKLSTNNPIDYKRLQKSFISKESFQNFKFITEIKKSLSLWFSRSLYSHSNKIYRFTNRFNHWIQFNFNFSYFVSLYRTALDIGMTNNFIKNNFEYFLICLFLNASDENKIFVRILYIVSLLSHLFKPLPDFLLLPTKEINCEQSYKLDNYSIEFHKTDIPMINNIETNLDNEISNSIWSTLKKNYLNEELKPKYSVADSVNSDFRLEFQRNFEPIIKQNNISTTFLNELYQILVVKIRYNDFYEFLIDIAHQCEQIVCHYDIGYNVINTTGLQSLNMNLSIEDRKNEINENYSYRNISKDDIYDLKWKVENIDIEKYYKHLENYFQTSTSYPEKLPFPLDLDTLSNNSILKEVFSSGYGKNLISNLKESYGQDLSIVKINEKYFHFSMKEPKLGIEILKEFQYDYRKELSNLKDNFNEMKNKLLFHVEQWIKNEISKEYISEWERNKIKNMRIELENLYQNINHELIKRCIIFEILTLEELKQQLEKFKSDNNLKKDAKYWLRTLEDMEDNIKDFLLENNYLFQQYFDYCYKYDIVNPYIFMLIFRRKQINIIIYEKLDNTVFELKQIEEYTYRNDKYKKQFQFWLNQDKFYEIEINQEISEESITNSTIIGYLQTPQKKIHLKSEYNFDNIVRILIEYYFDFDRTNENLFKEIYQNMIPVIEYEFDEINLFVLRLIIGEERNPSRKEILSLLKNIDQFSEFNPFILNQKEIFYEKIKIYSIQQTLIQQIRRVLLLVYQYKSLDLENNYEEKERILENILTNLLMKRSYNENIYPSWLLFEIENNLLIRNTQFTLIQTMIEEKENSIYQLNMGEGKTSVILIILSEILANTKQIVRINCLEPLIGVMYELLRNKFSRLLQKKIYMLPYSRGVLFSIENLEKIKEILIECQREKHILLVTPAQRLCFQLKKQEIILEYVQSENADDVFNWKVYEEQTTKTQYKLIRSSNTLKETLRSLKYIDSRDKILKYPCETIETFVEEIRSKNSEEDSLNIKDAFHILKYYSTKHKKYVKQQLDLLDLIDQFTFFDILDESDEILRHKKELNYTLGLAQPLDGGEDRWEIPFLLFKIIFTDIDFGKFLKHASQNNDCPVIFQENFRPLSGIGGGCSLIRFLKYEYFVENIKTKLCQKLCVILRLKFHEENIDMIDENGKNYGSYENFVAGKYLSEKNEIVHFLGTKNRQMLNCFLLAKAWLSHKLLYHVMNYRYRVEYGLTDKKDKEIAIPFRGKDLPSENSEYSHPDVMIGFTIISYLYRGLDLSQVKDGLIKLKNDPRQDKDVLLKQWVEENTTWIHELSEKENQRFPQWLKSFRTFDLENENRIRKVYLYLSRNFNFIQYYLSNFTFPHDAKYYEKKLTGNAHTLAGEGKTKGFSGTNDCNDTMPESIIPKLLTSQEGTNGKMLHILSRKINTKYQSKLEISNTLNLLDQVCEYVKINKDCYTLIDAGAMITEISNFDVSKYFIKKIHQRFDGIVYFSDKTNQIMVILRNENCLPISTCHIDIKKLFIYFDEVHTRGTDLKLPLTANGIVTLGKHMSKDKLMQAVMRLRDLDYKQSIVLWGSKEISADIAMVNGIKPDDINSKHVLTWVTYNTIQTNENDLYLVTKEKLQYIIKSRALEFQKLFLDIRLDSLIKVFVSEYVDSIEHFYGKTPQPRNPRDLLHHSMSALLGRFYPIFQNELKEKVKSSDLHGKILTISEDTDREKMRSIIEKVYSKLPSKILTTNTEFNGDQENERETEEIKRIEIAYVKYSVPIREIIWNFQMIFEQDFKEKGLRGEKDYPVLKELNKCFEFTNIDGLKTLKWNSKILATNNFIETTDIIDKKNRQYQNDYLKPVNMIVIHKTDRETSFIIISAFEAKHLIQLCQKRIDSTVRLIHIDDIDGSIMIPINAPKLTKEEKDVATIIRLFNGDCHYNMNEIDVIKKCVALVESDRLHEDKAISKRIHTELESKHYLMNNFITSNLAIKLANSNDQILLETENQFRIDLQNIFHSIINESIVGDVKKVYELPGLIKQLIRIRGKSDQYQSSTLKTVLE